MSSWLPSPKMKPTPSKRTSTPLSGTAEPPAKRRPSASGKQAPKPSTSTNMAEFEFGAVSSPEPSPERKPSHPPASTASSPATNPLLIQPTDSQPSTVPRDNQAYISILRELQDLRREMDVLEGREHRSRQAAEEKFAKLDARLQDLSPQIPSRLAQFGISRGLSRSMVSGKEVDAGAKAHVAFVTTIAMPLIIPGTTTDNPEDVAIEKLTSD